jgi:tape measure domain-containing protein
MTEATLRIKVDSSEVAKADKSLDDLAVSSGKAEKGTAQLTNTTNSLSNAARAATGFLAAMGATIGVREIIAYSDAWRSAENQLRLVTTGTSELAGIQQTLLGVANNTRSSFESTANLYSRLARATTEMGLSQSELVGITNTINQSFAVSGATAAEAAAAITQLSQGLAAGALRGDEFNSVAEQAPGIMRAIAESLNMTVGELRGFAAEGGITADIVVTALQKAAGSIENDFSKANATFSQSMVVAKNNMLEFVGGSEAVKTATGAAGAAIVGLTDNLDALSDVMLALAAVGAARLAPVVGVQIVSALAAASAALATSTVATTTYNAALMVTERTIVTTTASQRLLNGALALVGGPAGLAVLAAAGIYKLADAYIEHENAIGQTLMSNEDMIEAIGLVIDENGDLVDSTEAATKAAEDFQRKYKITTKDLIFHGTAAEITAGQVGGLAGAVERMTYVTEGFVGPLREMNYLTEGFVGPVREATKAVQASTTATGEWQREQERATEAAQRQWEGTRDFLAETFVDIWNNGGNAFQKLGDMAVATAKRIVAEWAAVKALEFVGIKSPGGSSGVGGSLVSSALGSLLGGGGSAISAASIGAGGAIGGVGAAAAGGTTAAGVSAAAAGGGGIMAGITGGASSAGSAIMGGLAAIPGWGWALGGVALLASQLDKSTPSGNAGFLIRDLPSGGDGRTFDVPAFASGFDPVGFARREDQANAVAVIDTFRQYDAALTNIANAAGLNVNYGSNNFGGFNEKGQGGGLFFGAANEDGRATSVPVEQQLTQFVGQWIKGLGGQVDQSMINDVLAAGSADEMVKRAAMLAGMPAYAGGGDHAGGWRIVGERGPEIEFTGPSRIVDANKTQSIMSGSGMDAMVSALGTLRAELADIRRAVARSSDIMDEWNGGGLPQERAA